MHPPPWVLDKQAQRVLCAGIYLIFSLCLEFKFKFLLVMQYSAVGRTPQIPQWVSHRGVGLRGESDSADSEIQILSSLITFNGTIKVMNK